jgi:hypothetical protein
VGPTDLLRKLATTVDKLAIPYAVVGSTASSLYGEPRLTNDIDVVIDLRTQQIAAFCGEFPEAEFYLSRAAVESAVHRRFQFKIIHPSSGLKIDCIVAGQDPFDAEQLQRGVRVSREAGAYVVRFAAPEDVIVKKLEYFRLGQSEKHLRDIAGILKTQADKIDRDYIRRWAEQKGLVEIWEAILERLRSP